MERARGERTPLVLRYAGYSLWLLPCGLGSVHPLGSALSPCCHREHDVYTRAIGGVRSWERDVLPRQRASQAAFPLAAFISCPPRALRAHATGGGSPGACRPPRTPDGGVRASERPR